MYIVTQQGKYDYINCGYHTLKSMATVISKYDPSKKWKDNLKVLERCLVDNDLDEYNTSKCQVIRMRNWSLEVFSQINIQKVFANYNKKCNSILFKYKHPKENPNPIRLKSVYFQNEEHDKEEIQTLDYGGGSNVISRLRIKGFDFRKNIRFERINLSTLLFFHEIAENDWIIKQPIVSIDKHNFLPSDKVNYMKMDNPFHLFVYKLGERKGECEESKRLYTIHPDHKKFDQNRINTTPICKRINEDYFNKDFSQFFEEISNIDLFTYEGMIEMDKSIRKLSTRGHALTIFAKDCYEKYPRFFSSDKPTPAMTEKKIYHTYQGFSRHFRRLCRLRFGTIIGLNQIYSFSDSLYHSVNIGLWKFNSPSLTPNFGNTTIITNLDDEQLDNVWNIQKNIICERSRSTILSKVENLVKSILSCLKLQLSIRFFDIQSSTWESVKDDFRIFVKYDNPKEWANDACICFWYEM